MQSRHLFLVFLHMPMMDGCVRTELDDMLGAVEAWVGLGFCFVPRLNLVDRRLSMLLVVSSSTFLRASSASCCSSRHVHISCLPLEIALAAFELALKFGLQGFEENFLDHGQTSHSGMRSSLYQCIWV
jgi:hypothetical protein